MVWRGRSVATSNLTLYMCVGGGEGIYKHIPPQTYTYPCKGPEQYTKNMVQGRKNIMAQTKLCTSSERSKGSC